MNHDFGQENAMASFLNSKFQIRTQSIDDVLLVVVVVDMLWLVVV